MIITMPDCGTIKGGRSSELMGQDEVLIPLKERITGRSALENVKDPVGGEVVVKAGKEITPEIAERIEKLGFDTLRIRSVLTCEAPEGVCAALLWAQPGGSSSGRPGRRGGDHRRPVDRGAGDPAHHAYLPHRRNRQPLARQPEIPARKEGWSRRQRSAHGRAGLEALQGLEQGGTIAVYDSEGAKARELERYKLEVGAVSSRSPTGRR